MEFSEAQIAALVLGYLKYEKFYSVCDEFIKCCPYFNENNQNIKTGKYFITRVAGMTLVDFLKEYAVIYSIVQGRLEVTNYYETHSRTSLAEQIMYLLDKEVTTVTTSTPVMNLSVTSEVDTTPAHSLPGNNEETITKTPKKKSSKKCRDKEDLLDVSEVFTQTLLEKHELHEKIAETINIVRNTPETSKPTLDEYISAGASKEIDALIKTVVQRTEEDPVYNKILDEIIETCPIDQSRKSKQATPTCDTSQKSGDPMDIHNNDAVRSIIEAAQKPDPPPPEPPKTDNSEVYVFDGTLDSYLKTSQQPQNPLYINTGGLIVMPQEATTKQFYIVNNPPLINVTSHDIMSMPTIIVSDENRPVSTKKRNPPKLAPKIEERPASHVRNLDFSTPGTKKSVKNKVWDADLRNLVTGCIDKSPSPKRKIKPKKKTKPKTKEVEEIVSKTPVIEDEKIVPKSSVIEDAKIVPKTPVKEDAKIVLKTPVKEAEKIVLKTPVKEVEKISAPTNTSFATPFNDLLEEQLRGVDLTSLPTPKIPITPGFALTPNDLVPYNQRSTDYSTSSSYYQPSDTEQNKSLDQLIEECKKLEDKAPPPQDKFSNLKILSDVVIEQGKVVVEPEKTTLEKFNSNVIGKKNLNLLKEVATSSSSSESDSDSDYEPEGSNKTVICKKTDEITNINKIINTVEVKKTLEEDTKKKNILSQLEVVRKRTVEKIKNQPKKPVRNNKKVNKKTPKGPRGRPRKKVPVIEKVQNENHKSTLVQDLAERGIHLMPNKTPQKPKPEPCFPTFDKKTYVDCEIVVHGEKTKKKTVKYDFDILKKSMSASVHDEDLNQDVTMIIRWTPFEIIYEQQPTSNKDKEEDDLMDYVFLADYQDGSPEKAKGGRKRKHRDSESDKQVEKKSKALENNLKLLKKIDVDVFLDKVHGE